MKDRYYLIQEAHKVLEGEQFQKAVCCNHLWGEFDLFVHPCNIRYGVVNGALEAVEVTSFERNEKYEYSVRMDSVSATFRDTLQAMEHCARDWA